MGKTFRYGFEHHGKLSPIDMIDNLKAEFLYCMLNIPFSEKHDSLVRIAPIVDKFYNEQFAEKLDRIDLLLSIFALCTLYHKNFLEEETNEQNENRPTN